MDIADLMDSDQRIMAATVVRDGKLLFDFQDGEPVLSGVIDGKLDFGQVTTWCNAVRSVYNARQERKEAEAASKAATVRRPYPEAGPPAEDPGRGRGTDPEFVSDPKAAMEAQIKSKVAYLVGRETELRKEAERIKHELAVIAESLSYYNDLVKVSRASKVRRKNRARPARKEVEARVDSGGADEVVSGSLPPPDDGGRHSDT